MALAGWIPSYSPSSCYKQHLTVLGVRDSHFGIKLETWEYQNTLSFLDPHQPFLTAFLGHVPLEKMWSSSRKPDSANCLTKNIVYQIIRANKICVCFAHVYRICPGPSFSKVVGEYKYLTHKFQVSLSNQAKERPRTLLFCFVLFCFGKFFLCSCSWFHDFLQNPSWNL